MNDVLERQLPPAWHKLVADPVNNLVFFAFGALLGITAAAFFRLVELDETTARTLVAVASPVLGVVAAFIAALWINERKDRKELRDYARALAADLWFMENAVSTLRHVTRFETKSVGAFKSGWKMYFGDFPRAAQPFLWHETFDARLPPLLRQRLRFLRREVSELSTQLGALMWQVDSSHESLIQLLFNVQHPVGTIHTNLAEIQRQLRVIAEVR